MTPRQTARPGAAGSRIIRPPAKSIISKGFFRRLRRPVSSCGSGFESRAAPSSARRRLGKTGNGKPETRNPRRET
jgi:hypothetical protein